MCVYRSCPKHTIGTQSLTFRSMFLSSIKCHDVITVRRRTEQVQNVYMAKTFLSNRLTEICITQCLKVLTVASWSLSRQTYGHFCFFKCKNTNLLSSYDIYYVIYSGHNSHTHKQTDLTTDSDYESNCLFKWPRG